jgi:hypothetical protein
LLIVGFGLDCFEDFWISLHEVHRPEQVAPVESDEVALILHRYRVDDCANGQRWAAVGLWVGLYQFV